MSMNKSIKNIYYGKSMRHLQYGNLNYADDVKNYYRNDE